MSAQMVVNWTKRAKLRLIARQDRIEKESGYQDVAVNWANRIIEATKSLKDMPEIGREVPEIGRNDIRELIVEQSTRVIYRLQKDSCEILTVRRCR